MPRTAALASSASLELFPKIVTVPSSSVFIFTLYCSQRAFTFFQPGPIRAPILSMSILKLRILGANSLM